MARRLSAAGHDVHAVTLPGLAERADEAPAASIDLSSHVNDELALLHRLDLRDATLVLLSYSGVVGGGAFFLREIAEKALASSNAVVMGISPALSDPCTSLAAVTSGDADLRP